MEIQGQTSDLYLELCMLEWGSRTVRKTCALNDEQSPARQRRCSRVGGAGRAGRAGVQTTGLCGWHEATGRVTQGGGKCAPGGGLPALPVGPHNCCTTLSFPLNTCVL